jgi:hypothetical protein
MSAEANPPDGNPDGNPDDNLDDNLDDNPDDNPTAITTPEGQMEILEGPIEVDSSVSE